MEVFNRLETKEKRKTLRNLMTKPERILWFNLRKNKVEGFKFRRQHGIGPFIADFYCPEAKLVVEVDGPTHFYEANKEYDRRRNKFMRSYGIRIVRVTVVEVEKNMESVLEKIKFMLNQKPLP